MIDFHLKLAQFSYYFSKLPNVLNIITKTAVLYND